MASPREDMENVRDAVRLPFRLGIFRGVETKLLASFAMMFVFSIFWDDDISYLLI